MLCVFAEGSNTPARAQKKTDPTGTILRAGECLDSVASGRTSLDHRGDSPENGKPGWRYPAGRDTSRCVKDARDLKNVSSKVG